MNNSLKHLLFLPITTMLWYYVCSAIPFYLLMAVGYIFSVGWILFFLFFFIFMGLTSLIFSLPSIVNNYILNKIYGNSWLSIGCHSLAGLLGVLSYAYVLYDAGAISFIQFWEDSKIKTILIFFPALGAVIGMVFSLVFSPVLIAIDRENELKNKF